MVICNMYVILLYSMLAHASFPLLNSLIMAHLRKFRLVQRYSAAINVMDSFFKRPVSQKGSKHNDK